MLILKAIHGQAYQAVLRTLFAECLQRIQRNVLLQLRF